MSEQHPAQASTTGAPPNGTPNAPYCHAGPAPSGPPTPSAGPWGYDWRYAPPAPRGNKLLIAGVLATALITAAVIVVGVVALTTRPTSAPTTAAAPASSTSPTTDTSAADRALCNAIAPLMAENDKFTNAYVDAGDPDTPARNAGTPMFISDTLNWIGRIQPVFDQHSDIDPYFRRSLQRFIDDRHLLVVDLTPGPLSSYAKTLYADSVGAYSGPLHVYDEVGVRW